MMMLKGTQKQSFDSVQVVYFLNYVLSVRCGGFLSETSILVFAKLTVCHSM